MKFFRIQFTNLKIQFIINSFMLLRGVTYDDEISN